MKKNSHYCWMMILSLFPAMSYSLPVIEEVVSGQVAIFSPDTASLVLHTSDFSIIQYQGFSIDKGERVQFVQPAATSVVLNRVGGGQTSSILGSLTSNGKIFLVNPNGVYFGPSAEVNVGSLIASTLDITNQDFLEGRTNFKQTDLNGSIVNQGSIQAETDVVLLSSKVVNEGQIVASVGKVMMAAGEKIILSFAQDKMISFSMEGVDSSAEIINEGICKAPEGEIVLSVNTARKIMDAVVNLDEASEGGSIVEEGGKIFLKGRSSLVAKNITLSGGKGSTLSVEGEVRSDKKIDITFDSVFLEQSFLQAPGAEICIDALYLKMNCAAKVCASGNGLNDAGLISFHANDTLILEGSILAKGGQIRGDGGYVKTYSENTFEIGSLSIDTTAVYGEMGTWFFNPQSLQEIDTSNIFSHLHIVLKGEDKITCPIAIEHKGIGLTLETELSDSFLLLQASLSTQEGEILLKSPLQLLGESPIYISSHGADITFKEVVEGSSSDVDLILNAGKKGEIFFEKSIGSEHPLAKIEVVEAKAIYLSNNLSTIGKSVTLAAPLHLRGDCKIDTTAAGFENQGADILLLQGAMGNHRLSLDAGSKGAINVKEGVGAKGAVLSAVSMKGSAIHLKGDIKADGGTIIYNGPVYLSDDMTMTDTGPTGIIFLDTLNSVGIANSLTLSAPIGKVLFLGEVGGIMSFRDLDISSNRVEIKSNINLEGSLIIRGPTYLLNDVNITASNITFEKTVEGLHNLTLDVGSSGSILLKNHVGKKNRIGQFRIVNAQMVTTEAIYANTILQDAGAGLTVFNGILDTVYQEGVQLTGTDFTIAGGVRTSNGGSLTIDQSGTVLILQDMDLSGAFYQSSIGNVELNASITTNQEDIGFTGHVLLGGAASLSTGEEGPGNITFLDEINSVIQSPYSLDFTLGAGDLVFADTIGAIAPLGDIIIYSARNVTASSAILSLSYTQLQGLGVGSYLGNVTSTGELGIYIFSNYLEFAGQSSGQLLKALGKGNMMLNSIYGGLGSEANPVKISVGLGQGTVYEGAFGTVYFASDENQVASICSVRSNPGCKVLYSEGGAAYLDVTPDRCCHSIPPTPPSPPPPPPSPNNKKHLPEPRLYYIPGIYTNYWFFKDTLGSAWYFSSDFATRWWDIMDYPCKPSIDGIFGLDEDCLFNELSAETAAITEQMPSQELAIPTLEDNLNKEFLEPSYLWNKILLALGLLSVATVISISALGEYRRVFNVRKKRKRKMKLWVKKAKAQLNPLQKFLFVYIVKPTSKLFGRGPFFFKPKKLAHHSLKAIRAALILRAARTSQYFHKASSKEEYFFEEKAEKPIKKNVFQFLKHFRYLFTKGSPAKQEPKSLLESLKNMKAKAILSLTQAFKRNTAPKKGKVFLEERVKEEREKPKDILQKMRADLSSKMEGLSKYFRKRPFKGQVFVEKVEKPLFQKKKSKEDN